MADEIFGPILPVIKYSDITTLPTIIAKLGDKPLAMYIYSNNQKSIDL